MILYCSRSSSRLDVMSVLMSVIICLAVLSFLVTMLMSLVCIADSVSDSNTSMSYMVNTISFIFASCIIAVKLLALPTNIPFCIPKHTYI